MALEKDCEEYSKMMEALKVEYGGERVEKHLQAANDAVIKHMNSFLGIDSITVDIGVVLGLRLSWAVTWNRTRMINMGILRE